METRLAGLERLMEVCRKKGVPVLPKAGGGLAIGRLDGFYLYPLDGQGHPLGNEHEEQRSRWPEPFRSSLSIFAVEHAAAYFFATVPSLADEEGRAPVVSIDSHEELYALPVASSLDRFLEVYSRFVEARQETAHAMSIFPWDVPELIARDQPLVELMRAGRFDLLMQSSEDARKWAGQVLTSASGQSTSG
jgi:hypothetical protein